MVGKGSWDTGPGCGMPNGSAACPPNGWGCAAAAGPVAKAPPCEGKPFACIGIIGGCGGGVNVWYGLAGGGSGEAPKLLNWAGAGAGAVRPPARRGSNDALSIRAIVCAAGLACRGGASAVGARNAGRGDLDELATTHR